MSSSSDPLDMIPGSDSLRLANLFSFCMFPVSSLGLWELNLSAALLQFSLLPAQPRGYNIGVKLVDEYLARSGLQQCGSFKETGNVIAKSAFEMFLGIQAEGVFRPARCYIPCDTCCCASWTGLIPDLPLFSLMGGGFAVVKVSEDGRQFSLVFKSNPFNQFVELPPDCAQLKYCNILCGVIRGALQMVRLDVDCEYVHSELQGQSRITVFPWTRLP